jgi:hypothetical protein
LERDKDGLKEWDKKGIERELTVTAHLFCDPAAGTYQTAAGFVCPLGQRQWLRGVNGVVVMPIVLPSFCSFRTAMFA